MMRESLKQVCENFVKNREEVKIAFRWDSPYIQAVCASELCGKGIVVDSETLKKCKKIVSERTGLVSNFMGNVKPPVATILATEEEPTKKMNDILEVYGSLKKEFRGTEYLALAAAILNRMVDVAEAEKYAVRGKQIYKMMKKEHPFLTSSEDSVLAILLAFSEKEDGQLIEEMEACYKQCKNVFLDGNAVQTLSHILSLGDTTTEEKCNRVEEIYQGLKKAGKKYGKHYELPMLGSLALLPVEIEAIVEDIVEVDEFLSNQKGYGIMGIDKKTRLMHAAMLVSGDYSQDAITDATAITGTLAMVAAQQAALMCVVASSVAASAAASS